MFTTIATFLALASPQTDAEAETFARTFEENVRMGDAAAVDAACDSAAAADFATKGLDSKDPLVRGFMQGLARTAGFGLGPALKGIVEKGGTYTLLRVRRVDGRPKALYRLLHDDGSVNYHDAEIGGTPPKIRDIYILASGETLGELYRRMLMTAVAAQPNALQRLLGKENEYGKALPLLGRLSALLREAKYAELWEASGTLPAVLKKDKHVLFLRCQAAVHVGAKEAERAFDEFRKAFPNDPSLDLLSVDPLTVAMKYPEALKALDALDVRLGGDPYLHVLRANIHTVAGDTAKAVEHCRKAVAAEKTLAVAYETLLGLTLQRKEFGATAETLDAYERDAGTELNDLTEVEGYEEFLRSEAGRAWLASRKKQ